MKNHRISRRTRLALSAKALGAATVIPATALEGDGAAAPSNRIVMGTSAMNKDNEYT